MQYASLSPNKIRTPKETFLYFCFSCYSSIGSGISPSKFPISSPLLFSSIVLQLYSPSATLTSETVKKKPLKYIFYLWLYLLCHNIFKCQKVKLATCTKRLYYYDNMRGNDGREKWEGDGKEWIFIPTKMYCGKQ